MMEGPSALSDHYISQFFTEARTLTELFSSHLIFTTHLRGLGYDGVPVCYSLGSTQDDGSMLESFCSGPQPCGKQSILYCHNQALVVQDDSTEYKEKYPLLYYMSPGPELGSVKVWMSSRTHSLILINDYGLPLQEATIVQPDEHHTPKFYLSASSMIAESRLTLPKNLLLVNPLEDISTCFGKSQFRHQRDIGEVNDFLRSIYSVKIQPALALADWPAAARDWMSRKRKWPTTKSVLEATEQNVWLIPHPSNYQNNLRAPIEDNAIPNVETSWVFDFTNVEVYLLDLAGPENTRVLLEAQVFLYQISDPNMQWHDILKPAFLWHMENKTPVESKSGFEDTKAFLLTMKNYLMQRDLPHYFLSGVNVLQYIPNADTEEMLDSVSTVLSMTNDELSNLWQGYEQADLNLRSSGKLLPHLKLNFNRLVELMYIQTYHRLHATSTVDKSIRLHRDLLQYLDSTALKDEAKANFLKSLVSASLGSVLTVKAGHAPLKKEKRVFSLEGESLLKQSMDLDVLSVKVKRAGFMYFKKEFQDVLELLGNLSEVVMNRKAMEKTMYVSEQNYPQSLWEDWLSGHRLLYTLYSSHEKPFAPDEASSLSALMEGQTLGYVPYPVSMASSTFLASYLYVMSLINLGRSPEVKDTGLLPQMLEEAEEDQQDMNEKRCVLYLNLLSNIYFQLGDRQTGVGMLKKSMTILSNPRNPARWKLYKMNMKDSSWKYLTWGAMLFAAASVTAFVMHWARPSLQ